MRPTDLTHRLERAVKKSAAKAAHHVLSLAGEEKKPGQRPWDDQFRSWIREAQERGRDPNDVADEKWSTPLPALEKYYFPLFSADSVVMELGPGTGRYTRHLLGKCREVVVVDYSVAVIDWMKEYFPGRKIRTVLAKSYELLEIESNSIDAIIANGVFEHLYAEGAYHYLKTFQRVLTPGGRGCFNFDNIMSQGGFARFEKELPSEMDGRSIFRFYHPDMIGRMAEKAGLEVERMDTSEERFAFLTFRKPD